MKTITYVVVAVACLLLAGCGLLSPEQQQTALQTVDAMVANGAATPAQAAAMREAILSGGQGAWWQQAATALVGAGLGYIGVRVQRGPPTQKVGLPQSKVT